MEYAQKLKDLFKSLATSPDGLSSQEADRRLVDEGLNEIKDKKKKSPVALFFKQFRSLLIYILIVAAIIAFIYQHYIDVYVIGAIVVLNAVMGFIQEYKAEKAIEALRQMVFPSAKVIRNGEVQEIKAKFLVPGDILVLEEGDKVTADARVIDSNNLRTVESSLTGESNPVSKKVITLPKNTELIDQNNMVFMGTFVAGGQGTAVVTTTGERTAFGKIAKNIGDIKIQKSHFELKINKLAKQMAVVAIIGACIIFLIGLLRAFAFEEIFLFTIASLVSGIPEGLPAILVIVLAIGANRMVAKKAIVRTLPATATLGVATVIATDKTGTLTQNTMDIEKVLLSENDIEVTGEGWVPKGEFIGEQGKNFQKLLHIASVCNNASLIKEEDKYSIIGDPTEGALVVLAAKAGLKRKPGEKLNEIPFSSSLKYRATISMVEGEHQLYVVGAPEAVMKCSNKILTNDGERSFNDKEDMLKRIDHLTGKAMRVLALAYRPHKGDLKNDVKDLIFVGVVGMIDPPRLEVSEAVAKAKSAGIRVIMTTGDHKGTALAIAKLVGIKSEGALTEAELMAMSPEEFLIAVKKVDVFARLTPAMKLKIAETLQKQGQIVAMTGDGVNDAPALKKADIGIAMGITGTDVAKEASDIVLLDDNFASIVNAIEQGRIVFDNTRQASSFLITTNFAEGATLITALAVGLPLPLLPTQILWLNLVTDGIPALSLAVEPGHEGILNQPPRPKKEDVLNREIIPFLLLIVITMTIGVLFIFNLFLPEGIDKARTGAFAVMSFTQLFNILNMRSLRQSLFSIGWFSNRYLTWGLIISILLQITALYALHGIFSFEILSIRELLIVLGLSSSVLFLGELYKYLRYGVYKKQ